MLNPSAKTPAHLQGATNTSLLRNQIALTSLPETPFAAASLRAELMAASIWKEHHTEKKNLSQSSSRIEGDCSIWQRKALQTAKGGS